MTELYLLVRRLRDEPRRSRNRHFDELSHPMARAARRLVRRLERLEGELRSGATVRVARHGAGVLITLNYPAVHGVRIAFLTPEEHALLSVDPALASLLAV